MTQAQVSKPACQLFLDVFGRAVGQLLSEPRTPINDAVVQQARQVLPTLSFEIRETAISDSEIGRLMAVIENLLWQLERHMQYYGYGWRDVKADPSPSRSFVREVLQ